MGRTVGYLDAYGLEVETDIALPGLQPARPGRPYS